MARVGDGPARAHAPGVSTFALHTLGWRAFQDLVGVVLREVLGQSFQTFGDSRDGGRDGAFNGNWRQRGSPSLPLSGMTVVQCKHTTTETATLTLSQLKDELQKVRRLVDAQLCESYLLVTNARLTGESEAAITAALTAAGVRHVAVLGAGWLCQTIATHRRLRTLVPRIYGLGDLSQILDERAYAQGRALLNYLDSDLSAFVVTSSYRQAAAALERRRFVLLLGEPAAGKSIIAAALAMVSLDRWQARTLRVEDANDFVAHWNPDDPGNFFWIDDAFGSVRHERALTDAWAKRLPLLMSAVRQGVRVVMTSRDYIYRDARSYLKEYAYPLLAESQVVVNVEALSRPERERILYNHMRLGDQPWEFKRAIKAALPAAAAVAPFRPEAARRLAYRAFTSRVDPSSVENVKRFMQNPSAFLQDIYAQLDSSHVAALACVYASGSLAPPVADSREAVEVIRRLDANLGDVGVALESLSGTFLRFGASPGTGDSDAWSFRHPTLREGFAGFIATHPRLLDLFVLGLDDDTLLSQADVGADSEGALIRVPRSLYPTVAARLAHIRSLSDARSPRYELVLDLLATRSSDEFLRLYVGEDPGLVKRLLPRAGAPTSAALTLLARLHRTGLLPDDLRMACVARLRTYATREATWLDVPEWQELLTDADHALLLDDVRSEFVSGYARRFVEGQERRNQSEDPADLYLPLISMCQRFREALQHDRRAVSAINGVLQHIESVFFNVDRYDPESPDDRLHLTRRGTKPQAAARSAPERAGRDVFDDVDL